MQQQNTNLTFDLRFTQSTNYELIQIYELRICLLIFTCHLSYFLSAQNKFPQNYFRSPIDTQIFLSATFGEPRMNHFHSGIDIKTNNSEGWKVYAAADGYVSRIKISSNGYGKAIYITHPNGYVTVYAHLQKFNFKINSWVKQRQYEKESFEIELYPDAKDFPIKKEDIIAYSGNSGGSAAPHLHFEIRDGKSEKPINPLQFGMNVQDTIPPILNELVIYSLEKFQRPFEPLKVKLKKDSANHYTVDEDIYVPLSKAGFGISTYDMSDGAENINGIYSLELRVENNLAYSFKMDSFSFDETRYANCHIDYAENKLKGNTIYRCFLLPGNESPIYSFGLGKGGINLQNKKLNCKITVADFMGNISTLNFLIDGKQHRENDAVKQAEERFAYNRENHFHNDDIVLHFPEKTFYDDFNFQYSKKDTAGKNIFSSVHQVHNWLIPLHKSFAINIKLKNLPKSLIAKAVVVYRDGEGNIKSKGGIFDENYNDGFMKAQAKELGDFFVMIDTMPPKIETMNISNGKNMGREESVRIRITDDLSGIFFYRGEIDRKWILMEYDAKNNLLTHTFDERISKGEHELKLTIRDERKNEKVLKIKFTK